MNRLLWERRFERVALLALVGLYLWGFHVKDVQDAKLSKTNAGLCALRADLEARQEQGRVFLRAHPQGAFGFSASAIRVNLAGQSRTIRALGVLEC